MSRVLLDTSAYSAMRRGDERLLVPVQQAAEVFLTPIVMGELLFGFLGGGREPRNRERLREFVESPRVSTLTVDEETAVSGAKGANSAGPGSSASSRKPSWTPTASPRSEAAAS